MGNSKLFLSIIALFCAVAMLNIAAAQKPMQKLLGKKTSSFKGILDDAPPTESAYSVRQLYSKYTGKCVRVRRSSDNTEHNVGFSKSHDIDEADMVAFAAGSDLYVVKWFDQSGNNNDLVENNTSLQMRIALAGTVDMDGRRPALFFPFAGTGHGAEANMVINKDTLLFMAVVRHETGNLNYGCIGTIFHTGEEDMTTHATGLNMGVFIDGITISTFRGGDEKDALTDIVNRIYYNVERKGTQLGSNSNNGDAINYSGTQPPPFATNRFCIGYQPLERNQLKWSGKFQELILWQTTVADSKRIDILANQKEYYEDPP